MAKVSDKSRFKVGEVRPIHKEVATQTTVGSGYYEKHLANIYPKNYKVGYVPEGYAHRPDLIANLFYGSPAFWWKILEINGISDPFEGLNAGDRIFLPRN